MARDARAARSSYPAAWLNMPGHVLFRKQKKHGVRSTVAQVRNIQTYKSASGEKEDATKSFSGVQGQGRMNE